MTKDKIEAVEEVIKPLKGFIDVDSGLPWYVPSVSLNPKKRTPKTNPTATRSQLSLI
jgi:hypothetical protein